MAIRALEDLLYHAQLNPGELCLVTQGMTDGEKSRFLWSLTSFPKPTMTFNGLIRVPDPDGSEHLIDHTRHDWGDAYQCDRHGFCWATHSAARSYRVNSGICYEANTGDSFHHVRMVEPLD